MPPRSVADCERISAETIGRQEQTPEYATTGACRVAGRGKNGCWSHVKDDNDSHLTGLQSGGMCSGRENTT